MYVPALRSWVAFFVGAVSIVVVVLFLLVLFLVVLFFLLLLLSLLLFYVSGRWFVDSFRQVLLSRCSWTSARWPSSSWKCLFYAPHVPLPLHLHRKDPTDASPRLSLFLCICPLFSTSVMKNRPRHYTK